MDEGSGLLRENPILCECCSCLAVRLLHRKGYDGERNGRSLLLMRNLGQVVVGFSHNGHDDTDPWPATRASSFTAMPMLRNANEYMTSSLGSALPAVLLEDSHSVSSVIVYPRPEHAATVEFPGHGGFMADDFDADDAAYPFVNLAPSPTC